MPLPVYKDRVREITNSTGTGTIALAGAVQGYQPFTAVGNGNMCQYCIVGGTQWEVGLGTYTTGNLARNMVLDSSSGGALVSFLAGVKDVFVDAPAVLFPQLLRFSNTGIACVNDFGAGLGADDTSLIQAAHDSLPTAGGTLLFKPGSYNISGTVNITKTCDIVGTGSLYSVGITQHTASATTFLVACDVPVHFENLTFTNTSGGTSIRFASLASNTVNGHSSVRRVRIAEGAIGINFLRAAQWTVEQCYIVSTTVSGIRVSEEATVAQDDGDSSISNCIFDITSGDCITWVGSGGLRVINNKLLRGDAGFSAVPAAGVVTADLLLTGNSIEGGNYGVLLQAGGGGSAGHVTITGNQLASNISSIICTTANIYDIVASGNTCFAVAADAKVVDLQACTVANISGNQLRGLGGTSIGIRADGDSITIGDNQYIDVDATISSNNVTTSVKGIPEVTFNQLPTCANGSVVYCSDGQIANPVVGGGGGCIAKRLNNAWVGN